MAISDVEAEEAFRFLLDSLQEAGFTWVISQVEEKLATGNVVTRKLQAPEEPELLELFSEEAEGERRGRRGTALFAVAEEYSTLERLSILLDSMILALPVVSDVAEGTFSNLAEVGVQGGLDFEPEANVTNSFSLTVDQVKAHEDANKNLRRLIEELRAETFLANPT